MLGVSLPSNITPVMGLIRDVASHLVISDRSYVWPSSASTGSCMTSKEMGHRNSSGTDACMFLFLFFLFLFLVRPCHCNPNPTTTFP
jgi:hypothetical protein